MQNSVVHLKNLDDIVFRLDAEYYHPDALRLESKLRQFKCLTIRGANGQFDCSAFYPSIVPYYDFTGKGVPFLRVNEIQSGLLHLTEETAFLPLEVLDGNSAFIARCGPGDLIIAKGGNSLAKVALLSEEYNEYSVCRDVIVLRTGDLKKLNKYYLWMFLHSSIGKRLLLRTASQTGQPHLTLEALYSIEIPLFSEEFQSLFERLFLRSQALKKNGTERYKKAQAILFNELKMADWTPKQKLFFVRTYADAVSADRLDAKHFHPKLDDLRGLLNKNSAYTKRVVDIQMYNARGKQPHYEEDGKLDVITSKHILEFGLDIDAFVKTNSSNWNDQKSARIMKGDILTYTTGANIGRTATYESDERALASNHVNILRIENEDPIYVGFVMNSLIGRLQTDCYSAGSAQAELYPQDIAQFVIPFISKSKQKAIRNEVVKSTELRMQSARLLESVRHAMDMAVQEGEQAAADWLDKETEEIGVEL